MHEDERLLIGGLDHLRIETIRNIPQSENYGQYIKVINIFKHMKDGMGLLGMKPHIDDVSCIKSMIDCELDIDFKQETPPYIQTLFHHFLNKQTGVLLNTHFWNEHFMFHYKEYKADLYGYKKFAKLFMKNGIINFSLFIRLMPNVKVITIGLITPGQAYAGLALSAELSDAILLCTDYMETSSKLCLFCKFQIVKPASSINLFIEQYADKFLNKGWIIKKESFFEPKFNISNEEMLCIEKLKN